MCGSLKEWWRCVSRTSATARCWWRVASPWWCSPPCSRPPAPPATRPTVSAPSAPDTYLTSIVAQQLKRIPRLPSVRIVLPVVYVVYHKYRRYVFAKWTDTCVTLDWKGVTCLKAKKYMFEAVFLIRIRTHWMRIQTRIQVRKYARVCFQYERQSSLTELLQWALCTWSQLEKVPTIVLFWRIPDLAPHWIRIKILGGCESAFR